MLSALFQAFAQLADPRLRRVVWLGVGLGLLSYGALVALVSLLLARTSWLDQSWLDQGAHLAAGFLAMVLPLPFLPAVFTAIMSFMLEGVADAVEARHYPELNWPRPQKWTEVLATTLRFLVVVIVANLLMLPVTVLLLVTGLSLPLSVALNGYLLGREYFELVALRRMSPAEARLVFRNHLGRLWLAGAVVAVLFSVPLLNLVAPVVGTAFMVHMFQSLRRAPRKV